MPGSPTLSPADSDRRPPGPPPPARPEQTRSMAGHAAACGRSQATNDYRTRPAAGPVAFTVTVLCNRPSHESAVTVARASRDTVTVT